MPALRTGVSSLPQQELLQAGLPVRACFTYTSTVSSLDLKYFRKLSNKYIISVKITTSPPPTETSSLTPLESAKSFNKILQ